MTEEFALVKKETAEVSDEFTVFHLDTHPFLRDGWKEREERVQQILDNEKWVKAHDDLLASIVGDAGRLFLEGREVAAWINDGTFKKKQFMEQFPDIVEECSEWQKVLNLDLVKKKFPEEYKASRARTMRRKNNPVVPS